MDQFIPALNKGGGGRGRHLKSEECALDWNNRKCPKKICPWLWSGKRFLGSICLIFRLRVLLCSHLRILVVTQVSRLCLSGDVKLLSATLNVNTVKSDLSWIFLGILYVPSWPILQYYCHRTPSRKQRNWNWLACDRITSHVILAERGWIIIKKWLYDRVGIMHFHPASKFDMISQVWNEKHWLKCIIF